MTLPTIPRQGIGPAPAGLRPEETAAWDDLVRLVQPNFCLIWRDRLWLELAAGSVADARREPPQTVEEVSCLCRLLQGLTLGPDALPALGLECEWTLEEPEDAA